MSSENRHYPRSLTAGERKHIKFLSILNKEYVRSISMYQEKIELHEKIIKLIELSGKKTVSNKEWAELAKFGCPDYVIGGVLGFTDSDLPLRACPEKSCGKCWSQYIKELNIALENDSIAVKENE